MEVRKGYKQTDLGIIPEDWDVKRLKFVCSMKSGNTITSESISEFEKYSCYGGNGLRGFTKSHTHSGAYTLIGRQGALCGNITFVDGVFFASEHAIVTTPNSQTNIKWLSYVLFKMNLNQYTESTAQPGLSVQKILELPIVIPPTKSEQTAIATALSDADALITSLEKLIAKKRLIKQGAMQELLSPTGSDGKPKEGWVVKRLGEIANFKNGKAHENFIDENGDFIVINSKFVSTEGEIFKRSIFAFELLRKGEIALVMSDIPNGKALAKCFIVREDNKYTLNQRICSIRSDLCDNEFLYRILNRNEYFLAFDSGVGQTNLKKQEVLDCPIIIPPTIKEQTRIATILSDMDAEITTLEAKLEKYIKIKLGMMQELLTGKIRLV